MLRLELGLRWRLGRDDTVPLDDAVFALLEGIEASQSLQTAARRARLSYRHAWGLVTRWGASLGSPLVARERGRGTRLTPLGQRVLAARRSAEARLGPELARVAAELAAGLDEPVAGGARRLRLHASHDLAVRLLADRLGEAHGVHVDLAVHGSEACLEALGRRRCDVAGFHAAPGASLEDLLASAVPRGDAEPLAVFRLVQREQGLIVAPRLHPPVHTLVDLAATGARFVNRQRGSGTRTLLDRLLREHGVRAEDIRGYQDEEFTHLAVAATVAGGGAAVGFGIRAAAAQFGLDFRPLAVETYYLACRAARVEDPAIRRLLAVVRGPEFRAICAGLPGYDATDAGQGVPMAARPGPGAPARRPARLRSGTRPPG